jgi:hypothetical protein
VSLHERRSRDGSRSDVGCSIMQRTHWATWSLFWHHLAPAMPPASAVLLLLVAVAVVSITQVCMVLIATTAARADPCPPDVWYP